MPTLHTEEPWSAHMPTLHTEEPWSAHMPTLHTEEPWSAHTPTLHTEEPGLGDLLPHHLVRLRDVKHGPLLLVASHVRAVQEAHTRLEELGHTFRLQNVTCRQGRIINIKTKCFNWRSMLCQMRKSMLCQTLHVRINSEIQKIQSPESPKRHCVLWR